MPLGRSIAAMSASLLLRGVTLIQGQHFLIFLVKILAYFFSNARLLNPTIMVSPLFFNFELPVTHLMVTLSIMQPHPALDNPLIYTEQQRQQRQNSSNI